MLNKCQTFTGFTDENTRLTTTPSPPLLLLLPCVHSTRPRVHAQNVPVYAGTTRTCIKHVRAWCWYTRGRFERAHGDVLSGHTVFFSVSHTTTPRTPHTQQRTATTTTTTTTHRDRDRGDDREDKTREKMKDKTREKRR